MTSSESQPRTLIADGLLNGRDPEIAKAIMGNGVARRYRKTALVWAFPLSEECTIDTPEGQMRAGIGDYLASDDPPTHLWPVRRDVFEATHVEAEAAQDSRPLDVERLARALKRTYPYMGGDEDRRSDAEFVAAEYARLAAEKPEK